MSTMGYTRALVLFAIFKSMTFKPLVSWVKSNKLAALVILVLFVLLYIVSSVPSGSNPITNGIGGVPELGEGTVSDKGGTGASEDRVVIEESTLSMVVNDVSESAGEVVPSTNQTATPLRSVIFLVR